MTTYPHTCPACGLRGRITQEQQDGEHPILCWCGEYQPRNVWRAPDYRDDRRTYIEAGRRPLAPGVDP